MVIGATGQLGSDLVRTFDRPGALTPLSTRDVDILDPGATRSTLEALRPTCVLNTAAYNLVDRAEEDGRSAFALNAEAVGSLADVCQSIGARLVHFSTDYVFDGAKRTPYLETDPPRPLSVYGESKLAGERLALERCEHAVVFRVCGLFGLAGTGLRLQRHTGAKCPARDHVPTCRRRILTGSAPAPGEGSGKALDPFNF